MSALTRLMHERHRGGYRMLHGPVPDEGFKAGRDRVYRLCRRHGLRVPVRRRVRRAMGTGINAVHIRRALHATYRVAYSGSAWVPFDKLGFPDFSKWTKDIVRIVMTGDHKKDFEMADRIYKSMNKTRPDGHTRHHSRDLEHMILVPEKLNAECGHIGGASIIRRTLDLDGGP